MAKAKRPNEIREEVRKQMAAKYKQDVEDWRGSASPSSARTSARRPNTCGWYT